MTLGNMRENGVRSLAVTRGAVWCHHQAILDVSAQKATVAIVDQRRSSGARFIDELCDCDIVGLDFATASGFLKFFLTQFVLGNFLLGLILIFGLRGHVIAPRF
jgi:hypothetical protein